jgi:hypothetical protein
MSRSIVRTVLLAALLFPAPGLSQTYGREKLQATTKTAPNAPAKPAPSPAPTTKQQGDSKLSTRPATQGPSNADKARKDPKEGKDRKDGKATTERKDPKEAKH